MGAKRVSKNISIAALLLALIVIIWIAWTFLVNPLLRGVGKVIEPIGQTEGSPFLPGVELHTLISGRAFYGPAPVTIRILGEANKSLEVFLSDGGKSPALLHKERISPEKELYTFLFNTTAFPDGGCSYSMIVRIKGPTPAESMEDSTGLFSIFNNPGPILWQQFNHLGSTDLSTPPYYSTVLLEKAGAGRLVFPPGMINPGADLDSSIVFEPGRLVITPSEFKCIRNKGGKLTVYFYNVKLNQPKLLLGGLKCDRCRIRKYENSTLVAELYKLGEIQVVEGLSSNLSVSNPTRDERGYHQGEVVTFTAKYTTLDGNPIIGGVCRLVFSDAEIPMVYEDGVYVGKKGFSAVGKFEYSAVCEDPAKESNNNRASDFVEIV
jgi:hypothetical protein